MTARCEKSRIGRFINNYLGLYNSMFVSLLIKIDVHYSRRKHPRSRHFHVHIITSLTMPSTEPALTVAIKDHVCILLSCQYGQYETHYHDRIRTIINYLPLFVLQSLSKHSNYISIHSE
jgi:hypothetical protein